MAVLALGIGLAAGLKADEKPFTFVYSADVLPKGGVEFEQWVTNLNGHASGVFSRWITREEMEFGLSDKLGTSFLLEFASLYDSQIDPSTGGVVNTEENHFEGVGAELKWSILDPHTDPLGVALYFEPHYAGPELELEAKAILEKEFGEDWVAGANFILENEYGYAADTQTLEGQLGVSAGLARRLGHSASIGLEVKNDREWPDWSKESLSAWYAGPAIHYGTDKWWATFTVLGQVRGQPETLKGDGRVLDDEGHAKVESRLILGFEF
jgi:hypothetical protein